MEGTQTIENNRIYSNERLQNMVKSFTKCKLDFVNGKEECKKLKETILKLESELKETRELEKSHRYHLQAAREMIGNLQNTVSQLVFLKGETKKLKDVIVSKDTTIATMEKDKEIIQQTLNDNISELRKAHESQIEELKSNHDKKLQEVESESETIMALLNLEKEELRSKIQNLEKEHNDKISALEADYEDKLQRSAAELTYLQEEHSIWTAQNEANLDGYRKKLQELESKLKQNQFKEYLAQSSYHSQFENRAGYTADHRAEHRADHRVQHTADHRVQHIAGHRAEHIADHRVEHIAERPDSVQKDYYDTTEPNSIPNSPIPRYKMNQIPNRNVKTPTLQVIYDNRAQNLPGNELKGLFKITKKRKLYSDKDVLNK